MPPTDDGHRTTMLIVFDKDGEPIAVLCDRDGDPSGQRWFTVVLEDTPGPDGRLQAPVCIDSLLETHPRLSRGLDVALEHRGAEWRDGAWLPAPELWD